MSLFPFWFPILFFFYLPLCPSAFPNFQLQSCVLSTGNQIVRSIFKFLMCLIYPFCLVYLSHYCLCFLSSFLLFLYSLLFFYLSILALSSCLLSSRLRVFEPFLLMGQQPLYSISSYKSLVSNFPVSLSCLLLHLLSVPSPLTPFSLNSHPLISLSLFPSPLYPCSFCLNSNPLILPLFSPFIPTLSNIHPCQDHLTYDSHPTIVLVTQSLNHCS